MQPPVFEYIPVLGASGTVKIKVLRIVGLDTRHSSTNNDHGRLYAAVTGTISAPAVDLYCDTALTQKVATGTGAVGAIIALAAVNSSGITGLVIVEFFTAADSGLVILASLATDEDVLLDATSCASLPGFNPIYGLAYLHAQAMRRIMTSSLPAAVPYLYGATGLAAFVPQSARGIDVPDISKLASADQLRMAQADLVKALSGKQQEHIPEFAALAKAAMESFAADMAEIGEANRKEPEAAAQEQSSFLGPSFGTFSRG